MAGPLPVYAYMADHRYPITLSGEEFILRWYWLDRTASWYLNIYEVDGTEIATGIRVVVNFSLLKFRSDPRLPAGAMMAFDRSRANLDPEEQLDLGDRVVVLYYEPGELPTVEQTTYDIVITETP